MTPIAHPVRRRIRLTSLTGFWLPLGLLVVSLTSGAGLMAAVAASDSPLRQPTLAPLSGPPVLGAMTAQRLASVTVVGVSGAAKAHSDAVLAGRHVDAMARHRVLSDRPRRPPQSVTLHPGQRLSQVRRRWHLSEEDLQRLNPDLDLEAAGPGTTVCVWRFDPDLRPRSVGRPNRGRLELGEQMPDGPGWVVRDPSQAYGIREAIDAIVHAVRVVMAERPGGQELMVADLSRFGGGRLQPHRSHASGRDADLTYLRHTRAAPTFSHTRVAELDVERTWLFVRTLLLRHDVDYIFMSRALQLALYEHARRIGEHPAFLAETFENGPSGHRHGRATIRYARGHHDHMHVRFACPPEADGECRAALY